MSFPALLAAALAAAHAEITNPSKNRTVAVKMREGGTYTFSYATLDHILDHARPVLAKNGLCILQEVIRADEQPHVKTTLIHKSGETYETIVRMFVSREGDNQALGSAISYSRRYAILALLCLSADDDEDGNKADGNDAREVKAAPVDHVKLAQAHITGQYSQTIKALNRSVNANTWEELRALKGEQLSAYLNALQAIIRGEAVNV